MQWVRKDELEGGPVMTTGAGAVDRTIIARGTGEGLTSTRVHSFFNQGRGERLTSRGLELRVPCEVVEDPPDGSASKMTCGVVETTWRGSLYRPRAKL